MNIELTEHQVKRIIELLEREWVNTGKAFYAGLSDNIVQQSVKQESKTQSHKEWVESLPKGKTWFASNSDKPLFKA